MSRRIVVADDEPRPPRTRAALGPAGRVLRPVTSEADARIFG